MKFRAKVERINVTLEGLRAVKGRIRAKKLKERDWQLIGALVVKLIARIESQQERMIAKTQAAAAQGRATDDPGDAHPDFGCHGEASGATSVSEAPTAGGADGSTSPPSQPQPPNPSDPSADKPNAGGKEGKVKAKGHGRNGAGAYTTA